ncbi:hypothetical protein RJ639_011244 [Escallonia herrerae]|uniref:Uncharacterized protein n=1 Tax=Escallonia herrerae TaxID=1293975 RepID=A0AA89AU67_9ASTE|nr:hypothetical protein RJ639_011244 [Escallonia herrerae]
MDLETENRIAAILMKEAAELRRQADKEGVHAYLRKPNVRGRPNSRFLTATVLGVQQSNRAVEVHEMWRLRQKERELDDRPKKRLRGESNNGGSLGDLCDSPRSTSKRHAESERNARASCSSSKRICQDRYTSEDEGLRDEEVEEFLQTRLALLCGEKRGRGAVGSRMDETGPYLPPSPGSKERQLANNPGENREELGNRVVLAPEKPLFLMSCESSEEGFLQDRQRKPKKCSKKQQSRKHHSKEKSKDKKGRKHKEAKRCKHHK